MQVNKIDVELLKAVSDRETLVAFISKQNAIDAQAATPVTVPQIVVPDAMLHQGHVAVRRSLLLDVRAESTNGLTRIEAIDESSWLTGHEVAGILPIKVYQAYRYSQVPFELRVAVNPVASKVTSRIANAAKDLAAGTHTGNATTDYEQRSIALSIADCTPRAIEDASAGSSRKLSVVVNSRWRSTTDGYLSGRRSV